MLREHNKLFLTIHKLWDICLTTVAFILAYIIKKDLLPASFQGLSSQPDYYIVLLMSLLIWYVVFNFYDIYKSYRKRRFIHIFWEIMQAVFVCVLLLILCIFVFKIQGLSRIFISLFVFINVFFLVLSKWFVYWALTTVRKRGLNSRNILIVGCNSCAENVIDAVIQRAESGYRIVGCLATDHFCDASFFRKRIPIIGSIHNFNKFISQYVVDEVIIAEPISNIEGVEKYIYYAENVGVPVHILNEWEIRKIGYEPKIGRLHLENIFGIPTLSLISTPDKNPDIIIKSILDYVFCGLGLVVFAVPMICIAAAIKIASNGPAIFKQERVGFHGRKFVMYKFRTMVMDAEEKKSDLKGHNESDGPVFKIKKDPRIIPYLGNFLRKTGLDELPQLINVLKGEMSVVGPRPPLPEEVIEYDSWQRRRLSMKPGITCIWQTNSKRNDVGFKDWVKMDLKYIDNWSLNLDFVILCKTVFAVIMGYGR
jgi:exopolysaccharide biosynthesis polyprenyl glycosylphosphotransferase